MMQITTSGKMPMIYYSMRLDEKFWQSTATDRSKVLSADWLKTEETNNVVKLKLLETDTPFFTDEAGSGELQNSLRSLLYRKS